MSWRETLSWRPEPPRQLEDHEWRERQRVLLERKIEGRKQIDRQIEEGSEAAKEPAHRESVAAS